MNFKTYIAEVDYKFELCKKGFVSRYKRKKLDKSVEDVIEVFGCHVFEKHGMYFTRDAQMNKSSPDRTCFLFRDITDQFLSDIQFEISQLEGVQSCRVYPPISASDLI